MGVPTGEDSREELAEGVDATTSATAPEEGEIKEDGARIKEALSGEPLLLLDPFELAVGDEERMEVQVVKSLILPLCQHQHRVA